jgi:hypothetical protein
VPVDLGSQIYILPLNCSVFQYCISTLSSVCLICLHRVNPPERILVESVFKIMLFLCLIHHDKKAYWESENEFPVLTSRVVGRVW